MSTSAEHPLLEFASRYGDPTQDYLNAYMAIARLDALLEDATTLLQTLRATKPDQTSWHPPFGPEVVSYYGVGFVTCLEWHAKSRLIDLLTFLPSALKIEDVKGTISDKLIVQMVAKQASVTQLVGAAVKVGSAEKYLSVIGRVFSALGMPFTVVDWLTGKTSHATACWIRPEQLAQLEQLFDFRNGLVHELGSATMGHWNVRDSWSPDEALRMGGLVASIICGIEAAFTHNAPGLFPNRLTEDRWPISTVETLMKEFERLDRIADAEVRTAEWNEGHDTQTVDVWTQAREAFGVYMQAETELIDTAGMLHWRYFDARTPLRVRLLRYRIDFLTELMSHFTSAHEGPAHLPSND